MRLIIGTVLALVLTVASSLADPAGTYRVSGTNPGSGSTYSGTVTVKRKGLLEKVGHGTPHSRGRSA